MTTSVRRFRRAPLARRCGPARLGVVVALFIAGLGAGCGPSPSQDRQGGQGPSEPGAPPAGARAARAVGFNLLLVTIDTTRVDRLGCYGHLRAETPNLDRLSRHGLQIQHAVAPAPLTLPSHGTIMTGLDVASHGVRDNGSFRLADEKLTLAEILSQQGYVTAAFIASYVLDARYGLAQGFATYDGNLDPEQLSGDFNERPADAVTDAALAWLDGRDAESRHRPLFAWVHYFDAHMPYAPPPDYATGRAQPYDGEIAFVDAQIGRLLAFLARTASLERTLVIVAADHGEALGDHGEETHSRLIYDSTMRVPLLFSCRALFARPAIMGDRVVSLADVFPTALGLLGIDCGHPIDGIDLLATPPDPDRAVMIETMAPLVNNGWAPLWGLRRRDDKYILAPRAEYFDLRADPGELTNLNDAAPPAGLALAGRLEERLRLREGSERVLERAAPLDPGQLRRLAALGYVQAEVPREEAGRPDPKDALPLWQDMMHAQAMSSAGRHAEAAARLQRILEQNPRDAEAWSIAALIQKRLQRWDEAERCLKRSLALRPTAGCYVRLAQIELLRGAFQDADATLDRAAALDPLFGEIYIARGDRLAMAGRFVEARREFERALEVDPIRSGTLATQQIRAVDAHLAGP